MPTLSNDEFESFGAPAASPSPSSPPVLSHDEFENAKPAGAEAAAPPQPSSWLDAAKETGKGLVRGTTGLIGNIADEYLEPFREIVSATRYLAGKPNDRGDVRSIGPMISHAMGTEAAPKTPAGRYGSSIGETVGNPLSYVGPGGMLAKLAMAVGTGAGGQAGEDIAKENEVDPLTGRLIGGLMGGPLAARAVKPQVGPQQQTLLDAGVRMMTPGQLMAGIPKSLEDRLSSVPILGSFVHNARGRSIESFNRAVANQALEPIGEQLPTNIAAGHDLIDEVATRLDSAYDRVVPQLTFNPDRQFAFDMLGIYQRNSGLLPPAQLEQYERIINQRLGRGGNMTGEKIKKIEEELNKIGSNYRSSPDPAQRDLGSALTDTVGAMRANLERSNPALAEELQRINSGWAMYSRMRDAASRRATSEGIFTPSDLLAAVKRGDRSVAHGSFARGNALMQDFAEAGQAVLPSKLPTSGTSERLMTAGLPAAAGYLLHQPAIAAAGAAAVAPYTLPSQWLLNRYVAPTTGVRAGYASAGRGAGTMVPFFTQSQSNPYSQ